MYAGIKRQRKTYRTLSMPLALLLARWLSCQNQHESFIPLPRMHPSGNSNATKKMKREKKNGTVKIL